MNITRLNYVLGNYKKGCCLELVYASKKTKEQCENKEIAKKLFGGDASATEKLLSRINALKRAPNLKDIIVQPQFRFHRLRDKGKNKFKGYFAIDIKSKASAWRLILRPLDSNKKPFDPCNIDEIAQIVEIIEIKEVSKHYE